MATHKKRERPSDGDPPKIQVNTRLYAADVEKLKTEARRDGLPWQQLLRSIVRKALAGRYLR